MKTAIFTIILISILSIVKAQKIQNIQAASIWAPPVVKIDGKLTEWGTSLQAYNKTVKLWYTIANDGKNIYLVVKSTDLAINNKILAGGISLTLNTDGKKKDKGAFVTTFPIVNRASSRGGRRKSFGQQETPDTAAIIAQQKQTLANSKEISAIGYQEITDTLISIYNEYSIKAAANIDDKGVFVYELSIPLKLLAIDPASQKEIAYDIKLNGLQLGSNAVFISGGGGGRNGGGLSFSGGSGGGGGGIGFGGRDSDASDLTSHTDFWGKYTLANSATK